MCRDLSKRPAADLPQYHSDGELPPLDRPTEETGLNLAAQTFKTTVISSRNPDKSKRSLAKIDDNLLTLIQLQSTLGFDVSKWTTENILREDRVSYVFSIGLAPEVYAWRSKAPEKMTVVDVMNRWPDVEPGVALSLTLISPKDAGCIKELLVMGDVLEENENRYKDGRIGKDAYDSLRSRFQEKYMQADCYRRCIVSPIEATLLPITLTQIAKAMDQHRVYICEFFDYANAIFFTYVNPVLKRLRYESKMDDALVKEFSGTVKKLARELDLASCDRDSFPYFLVAADENRFVKNEENTPEQTSDGMRNAVALNVMYPDIVERYRTTKCTMDHTNKAHYHSFIRSLQTLCASIDRVSISACMKAAVYHQIISTAAPWPLGTGSVARFALALFPALCCLPQSTMNPVNESTYRSTSSTCRQYDMDTLYSVYTLSETKSITTSDNGVANHAPRLCKYIGEMYEKGTHPIGVVQTLHFLYKTHEAPETETGWGLSGGVAILKENVEKCSYEDSIDGIRKLRSAWEKKK